MKTEHIPAGWNWSKRHPSRAAPDPLNSNPGNESHAPNRHTPPGPSTYSNPLFDAEDKESTKRKDALIPRQTHSQKKQSACRAGASTSK
eukprot:639500-Pelagomonas_calceolata.AAC.1